MAQRQLSQQFFILTPDVRNTLLASKLTAAEWRMWSYLVSLDPFGDRGVKFSPAELMLQCGIKKTAYFKAKTKFQELGLFDFQEGVTKVVNLQGYSQNAKRESQTVNSNTYSKAQSFSQPTTLTTEKPVSFSPSPNPDCQNSSYYPNSSPKPEEKVENPEKPFTFSPLLTVKEFSSHKPSSKPSGNLDYFSQPVVTHTPEVTPDCQAQNLNPSQPAELIEKVTPEDHHLEPSQQAELIANPHSQQAELIESAKTESHSAFAESESAKTESKFAKTESKTPKPALRKSSASSQTYQKFKDSLSEPKREEFLNFVKKQIENFTKPINDIEAWLAGSNQAGIKRWQVYYQKFSEFEQKVQIARKAQEEREAQLKQATLYAEQIQQQERIEYEQAFQEFLQENASKYSISPEEATLQSKRATKAHIDFFRQLYAPQTRKKTPVSHDSNPTPLQH